MSLQFFEAQRSGKLPRISNTPWRGNSGLWDSVLLPNGKNYSLLGGWYDDGGMLKLSYTTAFTVSMLSWAYYEFKGGYKSSNNVDFGANTIRWGADYLMKASVTNITSAGTAMQPIFVAQVSKQWWCWALHTPGQCPSRTATRDCISCSRVQTGVAFELVAEHVKQLLSMYGLHMQILDACTMQLSFCAASLHTACCSPAGRRHGQGQAVLGLS